MTYQFCQLLHLIYCTKYYFRSKANLSQISKYNYKIKDLKVGRKMISNIEDLRFLLSALIQMLPTILSITLITLFAFPEFYKNIKKDTQFFKKIINYSITMVIIFVIAIFLDIIALLQLDYLYSNILNIVFIAIIYSMFSILYLFYVLSRVLKKILKNQ